MTYEPWLVTLSVVMAIQGGYVGLLLADGLDSAVGSTRRLLLAGSAITLAVGIWSMHFVGMLAAHLPPNIDYLVLPTLISFLTCVLVVGIGVSVVHMEGRQWIRIAVGALSMGTGIFLMHYIGMNALHASENLAFSPASTLAAFVIAVVTSGIALWTLNRSDRPLPVWLAAVVLGIAVSGMHYTAMAGTTFTLCVTRPDVVSPALTRDTLAIVVAVVAFSISGGFLLSLVPDPRQRARNHDEAPEGSAPDSEASFDLTTGEPAETLNTADSKDEENIHALTDSQAPAATSFTAGKRRSEWMTVEKDGRARNIPIDHVRSIRANAHYTYVSDGKQEFFCKLSISAVEAALDSQRFMRVHRSYIVAIDHVAHLRRHGENGVVEVADAIVQCNIPVARARMAVLQTRIEDHMDGDAPAPRAALHE